MYRVVLLPLDCVWAVEEEDNGQHVIEMLVVKWFQETVIIIATKDSRDMELGSNGTKRT